MMVPLMCSQQPISFATDNLDDSEHKPSLDIFSDSLNAQAWSIEARASETSPILVLVSTTLFDTALAAVSIAM